jgi:hypothetical protein
MSLFRDDGDVLRTRKPGEADRIMPRSPEGHCARLRPRRGPYSRPGTRRGER